MYLLDNALDRIDLKDKECISKNGFELFLNLVSVKRLIMLCKNYSYYVLLMC